MPTVLLCARLRRLSCGAWRKLVAILAGLLLVAAASAQPTPGVAVRFERLGLDDGLSQSSVLDVLQDRRGFLWFATQDGLDRYDGHSFRTWRHDPLDPESLPTSYVQTLAETADGALWAGTWGGGLSRLDPVTEDAVHYQHHPDDPASLPDNIVTAILETSDGTLWVGTAAGLARLDRATGRFTPVPGILADTYVWSLAEDSDGSLWVGTFKEGVARLDTDGESRWLRHDPDDPTSLSDNANATVLIAEDGEVWVGTNRGLNRLDPATGRAERFLRDADDPASLCGEFVFALLETSGGHFWVGTGDGGLCRLDRATGRFTTFRHNPADPNSLPKNVVRALFEDRGGVLWVGTDGGGAAKRTGASERFGHYRHDPLDPASLAYDYVWALHDDGGHIWVGTDGGGLDRLDPATGRFTHHRSDPGDPTSLPGDVVLALEVTQDGALWAGTFDAGLARRDPETGQFARFRHDPDDETSLPGNVVTAVRETADGTLWVGTWGSGLARRDLETGQFARFRHDPDVAASLPGDVITTLVPSAQGGLWVGTYGGGLGYLDHATNQFERVEGLSYETVYAVHEDEAGRVWIGTAGGGLNRIGVDGRVRVYTERDGLPHNIVYGIVEDEAGHLWLSTNRGLARFDPSADLDTGGEAFRVFSRHDGLQSDEFNSGAAHRAADGSLLFGGIDGFNYFHPDDVRDRGYAPPVVLTGLRRFDVPVQLGRALDATPAVTISHEDNFVTFEFAALDFAAPSRTRYAYRLSGMDPAWRTTDGRRPTASYTDLPGGTYTFEVRAAVDGPWSAPTALEVTVVPPVWARTWFRVLAALAGLGLGVLVVAAWHRDRMRRLDQARADTVEAQRRLNEGREQERLRMARDLHDGPLQDLYGVRFRLETLADSMDGEGRARVESVREALGGVSQTLRTLCTELRPPVLGPFGLARALRSFLARTSEEHPHVRIDADLDADGQALPERVRVALYRVAQEALRNALRHGAPTCVEMRLRLREDQVELAVEDDGRGFVLPERWVELTRQDHLGLVGAAERVEAVGGRLVVETAPGRGTRLSATVPLPTDTVSPPSDPKPEATPDPAFARSPTPR